LMKSIKLIIILLAIFGLCAVSMADDEPLMALKFEQYPAKKIYKGKPAPPILKDKNAKLYKTSIREGATDGPNFAGEYTIVTHGCGACCNGFFIVSARTGKVYKRPFIVACHYEKGVPGYGVAELNYQLDSKLLIVRGSRDDKGGGEYYYLWEKDQLKLLKSLEKVVAQ